MGRKSNNLENEVVESQQLESQQLEEAALNVDGTAVGIVKNANGAYTVVKLELDSVTGASRITKTLDAGNSKLDAAERFKILAVEEGLVV